MQYRKIKNIEARTGLSKTKSEEIKHLFQEHIYGALEQPKAYPTFDVQPLGIKLYRRGVKARFENVTISYNDKDLNLLLIKPIRDTNAPTPCILFLNSLGNHTVSPCKFIPISKSWVPNDKNTHRGAHKNRFDIELALKHGYTIATVHESDIAADNAELTPEGCLISKWASGLQRCVDYLTADHEINAKQIGVFGFSRRGKAALLATAFDERIALVIAHQSGTGGAAPSFKRTKGAETVEEINTKFPHWFNDRFKSYNSSDRLPPVEQFDLLSLITPRPILVSNARDDIWSDPKGTFATMKAVSELYKDIHVNPFPQNTPDDIAVMNSPLCYTLRNGEHGLLKSDWINFIAFANAHLN